MILLLVGVVIGECITRDDQTQFLAINAELSLLWPVITEMKDAPADADDWREVKDKLQYLERE